MDWISQTPTVRLVNLLKIEGVLGSFKWDKKYNQRLTK
jgi:hypothetical protein